MKVIEFIGELSERLIEQLRDALSERQDVEIRIDSPGGDGELKDRSLALLEELHSAGLHSTGIVTGRASSSAFMILQGCKVRKAFPEARLMFHPRQVVAPPGVYIMGGEISVDSEAEDYLKFLNHLSERSGISYDQLWNWGYDERVFTAREALECRFIDEIVRPWTPELGEQVAQRINEMLANDNGEK